jgi:putative spermidine/putrescine transport system permease protein
MTGGRGPRLRLLLAPCVGVLTLGFVIPVLLFLTQSLHSFSEGQVSTDWTLATFSMFITDPFFRQTLFNSAILSGVVTLITLVMAYPVALQMLYWRGSLLFSVLALVVFSPVLVSIIVRAYGWQLLLSNDGVINYALTQSGVITHPLRLIFNWTGVIISMVHVEIPFMMFPILTVLLQLQPSLRDAARDLGATELAVWRRVTLPLSLPGILAGCQIVFTTAISAFASPTILGGGRVRVMPVTIFQNIVGLNWPMAAVQSILLLLCSLLLVAIFSKVLSTRRVRGLQPA